MKFFYTLKYKYLTDWVTRSFRTRPGVLEAAFIAKKRGAKHITITPIKREER